MDIIKETRSGYGSWLEIKCACGASNKVATDTTHRNAIKGPGRPIFYINTKIASAMLHTGFGSTTTGRFFNAIGVPALTSKNLKSREREIGVHFQNIASESCKQSLQEEAEKNDGIVASFDAGWQSRGSARAYNSKSGHAALIGTSTGKIINYAVRNRNCKQCEVNPLKEHDCRCNWGGSAKAMEADIAVELVNKTLSAGHQIKAIVADEDSSTMAKIRSNGHHTIEKYSDINHTQKIVKNDLYKLKDRYRVLSAKVINYLCR